MKHATYTPKWVSRIVFNDRALGRFRFPSRTFQPGIQDRRSGRNALVHIAVAIAIASVMHTASAAENSGFRNVLDFGCHKSDGTCYVTIDGAPVTGASGCSGNNIRWDAISDANGKAWIALVMFAKAQNRRINLYADGCYLRQPSYPTFTWGSIE